MTTWQSKRDNRGYQVHVLPLLCVQSWFWLEMIPRGEGGSQGFTQEISLCFFLILKTPILKERVLIIIIDVNVI